MISDVLSDAVGRLDHYLDDPLYDSVYQGDLRADLIALRGVMDAMRQRLDQPPHAPELSIEAIARLKAKLQAVPQKS